MRMLSHVDTSILLSCASDCSKSVDSNRSPVLLLLMQLSKLLILMLLLLLMLLLTMLLLLLCDCRHKEC
jgi:hypothetical protein